MLNLKNRRDSNNLFVNVIIEAVGPEVEILAQVNGAIVAAREKQMIVTSFSSRITRQKVHAYFLDMINQAKKKGIAQTYDIVYFWTECIQDPSPDLEIMKKHSALGWLGICKA